MQGIHRYRLPDSFEVADFIEDPLFTEVNDGGEVYTTYRVLKFTHAFSSHPSGWTHIAQVENVYGHGIYEAFLEVVRRHIERSRVRHEQ
jgi:hypothetical protein